MKILLRLLTSSNYAGACGCNSLTNEDLLKLTDEDKDMIYGPTLFALKYRVVPCIATENSHAGLDDHDDVFTYNSFGQFSTCNRGQRWSGKRRQGGVYHATRLVT